MPATYKHHTLPPEGVHLDSPFLYQGLAGSNFGFRVGKQKKAKLSQMMRVLVNGKVIWEGADNAVFDTPTFEDATLFEVQSLNNGNGWIPSRLSFNLGTNYSVDNENGHWPHTRLYWSTDDSFNDNNFSDGLYEFIERLKR